MLRACRGSGQSDDRSVHVITGRLPLGRSSLGSLFSPDGTFTAPHTANSASVFLSGSSHHMEPCGRQRLYRFCVFVNLNCRPSLSLGHLEELGSPGSCLVVMRWSAQSHWLRFIPQKQQGQIRQTKSILSRPRRGLKVLFFLPPLSKHMWRLIRRNL